MQNQKPCLSAITQTLILAGGQSSRMGRDKALLPLQGVPLLRHLVEQVLPISEQVYIVTPWPERYAGMFKHDSGRGGMLCQFIPDLQDPPQGPLAAFAQGLSYLVGRDQLVENCSNPLLVEGWVLLLACDLPFLTTAVLQDWLGQLPHASSSISAALPLGQKGWEPLCGFYRRGCLLRLRAFLEAGGRSFQGWLQGESVLELEVCDDRKPLFNCNTPADWRSVCSSQGGSG